MFLLEQGVAFGQINFLKENRDYVANLQLLDAEGSENQSKNDRDLTNWLDRLDDGKVRSVTNKKDYFDQHLVPSEPNLHEYENYPEFLSQRLELMRRRLEEELPLKEMEEETSTISM